VLLRLGYELTSSQRPLTQSNVADIETAREVQVDGR